MSDLTGQEIRGYTFLSRISTGGFGAVYRAYQASVEREVAIKVILPQYAQRPEFIERFESEAQLIARLEHIHVVPIFDFWRTEGGGNAFIVMRWMRGGSLRSRIRQGTISPEQCTLIVDQISKALHLAHNREIIHRDVKPDNILFDEHNNAYLSDFGIAKDASKSHFTQTGQTPNTPAYASPEQIIGEDVTPASDIYSLAMTIYESLAGHHPFPETPMQHLRQALPPLFPARTTLLDNVLLQATAKEPTARYSDALAFSKAFQMAIEVLYQEVEDIAEVITSPTPKPMVPTPPKSSTPPSKVIADVDTTVPVPTPGAQSAVLINETLDIPLQVMNFVGRETLLSDIEQALAKKERVLLHGMGGIGKSTLAATIASRWLQGTHNDTDSKVILWLETGNEDARTLLLALARPFDAHRRIAAQPDSQQTSAIRRLIEDKGVTLIVLDDAWNGRALKQILAVIPPNVAVLVTARQRFPVGNIIDVDELNPASALDLLNHHAQADLSMEAASALLKRLGYHPFAIEMAGCLLQVDMMEPDELLADLGDTPHEIGLPESFADAKRETIKQLLNTSVQQLSAEERRLFFALGALFAPQSSPELIALLLDEEESKVKKALTTLSRRGITRRRTVFEVPCFRLHELAYSYAASNPALEHESAILACEHFLKRHQQDLNWLDAERANILGAAQHAKAKGNTEKMIELLRILTVDSAYFQVRGHDHLMSQLLDDAIDAARATGEHESLLYLLGKRGNLYIQFRGDIPKGISSYEEALALADEMQNEERSIMLRLGLAHAQAELQNFRTANEYIEYADARTKDSNDIQLRSRVLMYKAYVYGEAQKDHHTALKVVQEQVTLAERIADEKERDTARCYALQNMAAAHTQIGQHEQALEKAQEALGLAQKLKNRMVEAYTLQVIGYAYVGLARHTEAQSQLDAALALCVELGLQTRIDEIKAYMEEQGYTTTDTENNDA